MKFETVIDFCFVLKSYFILPQLIVFSLDVLNVTVFVIRDRYVKTTTTKQNMCLNLYPFFFLPFFLLLFSISTWRSLNQVFAGDVYQMVNSFHIAHLICLWNRFKKKSFLLTRSTRIAWPSHCTRHTSVHFLSLSGALMSSLSSTSSTSHMSGSQVRQSNTSSVSRMSGSGHRLIWAITHQSHLWADHSFV